MKDKDQKQPVETLVNTEASESQTSSAAASKRKFVEPEISQPVNVLEATTFFQGVDSGVTLP